MTYIIRLQIFSCVLCFVLHGGNSGVTVRSLQTSDATLISAKTSLNIFKPMSGRFHICLWPKTELKLMTWHWNVLLTGLCVCTYISTLLKNSTGIIVSLLNRICLNGSCPQILKFYFFFNKMFADILMKICSHIYVSSVLYLNKFK